MKTFDEMKKIDELLESIKDQAKDLKREKKLLAKKLIEEEEEAFLKKCKKERNIIELFLSDIYYDKMKACIEILETSELTKDEKVKFLYGRLEFKEGWIERLREYIVKYSNN